MAKALISLQMQISIQENTKTVSLKAKVSTLGRMDRFTLVNLRMV